MNNESLKIANDNLYCANKLLKIKINELNKTINELRESVINWDIGWYALSSEEDHQRLQELKDILEIKEYDKIEKIEDINTDYYAKEFYYDNLSKEEITLDIQTLKHKINEIIDSIYGSDKIENN